MELLTAGFQPKRVIHYVSKLVDENDTTKWRRIILRISWRIPGAMTSPPPPPGRRRSHMSAVGEQPVSPASTSGAWVIRASAWLRVRLSYINPRTLLVTMASSRQRRSESIPEMMSRARNNTLSGIAAGDHGIHPAPGISERTNEPRVGYGWRRCASAQSGRRGRKVIPSKIAPCGMHPVKWFGARYSHPQVVRLPSSADVPFNWFFSRTASRW